jgi:excisionase family DNA binding protein
MAAPQHTTGIPWRDRPTLRESEVAELIGISQRQVGRMVESGELQGRRVGTVRLVLTESLIAWEKGNPPVEVQKKPISPAVRKAASLWHQKNFG